MLAGGFDDVEQSDGTLWRLVRFIHIVLELGNLLQYDARRPAELIPLQQLQHPTRRLIRLGHNIIKPDTRRAHHLL